MNFSKLFSRTTEKAEASINLDPNQMPEPNDHDGYLRRGWLFHSRGMQEKAQEDFQKSLALEPGSVDSNYALGLVFKSQGREEAATQAFQRVVELLDRGEMENKTRQAMLRRFALGHISQISSGDWNLEEQIWHRRS